MRAASADTARGRLHTGQVDQPLAERAVLHVAVHHVVNICPRFFRRACQFHPGLGYRFAALAVVAALAGAHQVVPGVRPGLAARDYVVEGEVARAYAAILAGIIVADEYLFAAEAGARVRSPDEVLQADDRRAVYLEGGRPHDLVVKLQHLGLSAQHQNESAPDVAHVERLKILV